MVRLGNETAHTFSALLGGNAPPGLTDSEPVSEELSKEQGKDREECFVHSVLLRRLTDRA